MKRLVITLCLIMLMPGLCYALDLTETGDTRATPVLACGKTSSDVVTELLVDSTGRLTLDPNFSDKMIYVSTVAGIQTAIDTLEAGTGGVVEILAGNYLLTSNLTIDGSKPIVLRGQGTGEDTTQGTFLNGANLTGSSVIYIGDPTTVNSFHSIIVENMTVRGNVAKSTTAGIEIVNMAESVTIRNVHAKFNDIGFYVHSQGSNLWCYANSFFDCYSRSNNTGYKVATVGSNTNYCNSIYWYGGWIGDNTTSQVTYSRASGTTDVSHCKMTAATIDDANTTHLLLNLEGAVNNIFEGCTFDGVDGNNMIVMDADAEGNMFFGCDIDSDITKSGVARVTILPLPNATGYLFNDGNVGIGIDPPTGNLDVLAGTQGRVKITPLATETGIMLLADNATNARSDIRRHENYLALINAADTTSPATTAGIAIDNVGNVGIGDISPDAKLDVVGDVIFSSDLTLTGLPSGSTQPGGVGTNQVWMDTDDRTLKLGT